MENSCLVVVVLAILMGAQPIDGDLLNQAVVTYGLGALLQGGPGQQIEKVMKKVQDKPNEWFDKLNDYSRAVDSKLNSFMDNIDGHALENRLNVLLKPARISKSTCLQGIQVTVTGKSNLKLFGGRINNNEQPMKIVVEVKEDYGVDQQRVDIKFTYQELAMLYFFENKRSFGFDRQGKIKLKPTGLRAVVVSAIIPKSLAKVDNMVKSQECFVNIRSIKVSLGSKIAVDDIIYDSFNQNTLGLTSTAKVVSDVVDLIRGELLEDAKKSLRVHLQSVLSNDKVFCDKKNLAKAEPVDCKNVRDIGTYKVPVPNTVATPTTQQNPGTVGSNKVPAQPSAGAPTTQQNLGTLGLQEVPAKPS